MQENTKLIVEYQELDKNLKAIEDELNGSEVAKKYLVARKFLSTVKESLSDLDKKAQVATDSYNASVKELESLVSSAKELESSLDGCETEEEIEYLKKKYQDASAKISIAEQKVNALSKEMTDLYNEYRKLGQQNKVMKEQYDEFAPKLDELKNSKKDEVQKLRAELKALEGKIDKTLMEKYLTRRKDKKFPIVFGLDLSKKLNYCPFCATSMPMTFMEELSSGEIKECESCHRLIYGFEGKK
jgi:predicted  nucleic acid-binding Zn-ribbon protein